MQDLKPARLVTENGYTGFANEVGPHNPDLQRRFLSNPVAEWSGRFIESDARHPDPEYFLDIYDGLMYAKRGVFKAPRSYAKSTAIKRYVLFVTCEYENIKAGKYPNLFPHNKIRMLSCSGTKIREILLQVREELDTNPNIIAQYGRLQGDKWTEDHLICRNGVEITVAGRGAQVRGFRPTLLILDDVDDDEEVMSDERMEKAFEWFDKAVYNTLDEDDYQCFVIGTTLEEVSLLTYIAEKPSFEVHTYQAYMDGLQEEGQELWPSKWPHAKLLVRKADIGHRAFMSEFMNEPQPSENPIFERSWFKKYSPDDATFQKYLEQSMFTFQCIDPAISRQDKADYSAIVTVSVTFDEVPRIYIRTNGVRRGHWSLGRQVTESFNLYDKFYARELGVEKVAYQEALGDEIDAYMEINHRNMTVDLMVPDGNKERRANSVSPYVERGSVFYDPDDPLHVRLIDECVLFKPGKLNIKKDLMDAFVYCLIKVKAWERRRKTDSDACVVLPGNHKRSIITGV